MQLRPSAHPALAPARTGACGRGLSRGPPLAAPRHATAPAAQAVLVVPPTLKRLGERPVAALVPREEGATRLRMPRHPGGERLPAVPRGVATQGQRAAAPLRLVGPIGGAARQVGPLEATATEAAALPLAGADRPPVVRSRFGAPVADLEEAPPLSPVAVAAVGGAAGATLLPRRAVAGPQEEGP